MRHRPLDPGEMYPARSSGVTARFIDLATGVRIRVAESGAPDAPPVVLLHGWGASLYTFRDGFARLAAKGFRVVGVDLRGFGLSSHPAHEGAYTLDAYVADLDALLTALALREPPALVGHSMGGGIALHFALTHPARVRALGLIAPTGLVPVWQIVAVRVTPRAVAEAIGERLIPRWLVEMILKHAAFHDASRVSARDVDEYWAGTQISGFMRAVRRTATEFDWTPLPEAALRSLNAPVTVVLGTEDRLVRGAGPAARRFAGSAVYEFSGGHCVHEEKPAEVYDALAARMGPGGLG